MHIGISLLLVAFFLAMNAFFVIAEFAMVRVRPSQIEMALQEGKPGAKAAKRVTENVNAYLAARSHRLRWVGSASRRSQLWSGPCSRRSACPARPSRRLPSPSATS